MRFLFDLGCSLSDICMWRGLKFGHDQWGLVCCCCCGRYGVGTVLNIVGLL